MTYLIYNYKFSYNLTTVMFASETWTLIVESC